MIETNPPPLLEAADSPIMLSFRSTLFGSTLKTYRAALDLLSEMPQILAEIGLEAADLPHHSTLVKAFDRFTVAIWRVLLRLSAQPHEPSGHAAIDSTFFDRENASRHYCRRTDYRV